MHYYLYEITNQVNGKIYVGVHKTKSLDDGYMGSGKVIRSAIEKYGIENFTKVILETFDDSTAMYAREREVVTDEFLSREDVYNLRCGGFGGFDHINKNNMQGFSDVSVAQRGRLKTNAIMKARLGPQWNLILASKGAQVGNAVIAKLRNDDAVFDQKIRDNVLKAQELAAAANRQLVWVTNGTDTMKINKDSEVPSGWRRGRVGKFTNKKYLNQH